MPVINRLRHLLGFISVLFSSFVGSACDCVAPGPACAYVTTAPVVFVGTPVYTNDDQSGTFLQQTLYKFEVEEVFKGLPDGTKEVWIDPGSFTSCYAEYRLGAKLLVFASKHSGESGDSTAMTVAAPGKKTKPLPPGFDRKMPVYYAPECNGTRPAELAAADIAWLRSWKKGKTRARLYGEVLDDLRSPLEGATVTAKGKVDSLTTTTSADGIWTFDMVEAGKYQLNAELPNYRLRWNPVVDVPENACAYFKLPMEGSGSISGIVLNTSHKPVAGIEVELVKVSGNDELSILPPARSSVDGSFGFERLPTGDFAAGVNLKFLPSAGTPYEKTYLPGVHTLLEAQVIHIKSGQRISALQLQLPQKMQRRTLKVHVVWPDGRSAGKDINVSADVTENHGFEFAQTNAEGVAILSCLASFSYKVTAKEWLSKAGENPPRSVASPSLEISPGTESVSITLVLSRKIKDDP